jgi:hypothetical protein
MHHAHPDPAGTWTNNHPTVPLSLVYASIVVSHLGLRSSVELAGQDPMFCYFSTSGGSLEFAFVFVSVLFAFADCGMWNAAMVVFA